jgi:hypothetical protein
MKRKPTPGPKVVGITGTPVGSVVVSIRLAPIATGPRLHRAAALQRLSPRADIRAGLQLHALGFTRDLLDAPMPQADQVMARAMEAQCAEILEKRQRRRGTAARVRASPSRKSPSGSATTMRRRSPAHSNVGRADGQAATVVPH